METKVNLNEGKKSNHRLYLGIIMFLFSVGVFIYSIVVFNWFFIFYAFFFSITGISHIYEGRGKLFGSILGERFIIVDEAKISIKLKTLKTAQTIEWGSIESIKYGSSKIEIITKTDKIIFIEYSNLNYNLVQKIKDAISTIEKKRDVVVT